MEGRHRSQEGHVRQADLLLQTPDGLLHRGAPTQQVEEEEGGLDGAFAGVGTVGIGGKAPVVELAPHEPALVEPLIEHRALGQEQAGTGAGVPQYLPLSAGHRDIGGAPGENGDLGPLRQPVKVVVPAPEVFAVPGVPAQGAASGRTKAAFHIRASSRLLQCVSDGKSYAGVWPHHLRPGGTDCFRRCRCGSGCFDSKSV